MTTLEQLCEALGWQGGTIHDAIAEVRKLKAELVAARERIGELEDSVSLLESRLYPWSSP